MFYIDYSEGNICTMYMYIIQGRDQIKDTKYRIKFIYVSHGVRNVYSSCRFWDLLKFKINSKRKV